MSLEKLKVIDLAGVKSQLIKEMLRNHIIIPIRNGAHNCDFDVCEELLNPYFIWERKYREAVKARRCGLRFSRQAWVRPIGIDKKNLPAGAIIRFMRVSEKKSFMQTKRAYQNE